MRTLGPTGFVIASVLGCLTTAGAMVAPLLIVERDYGQWLHGFTVWSAFLAALLWAAILVYLLDSTFPEQLRLRAGPIGLVLYVCVAAYVGSSYRLLLGTVLLRPDAILSTTHLAGQARLAGAASVLWTLILIAHAGAVAGKEPVPDDVDGPDRLVALLRLEERRLAMEGMQVHEAVKALREKIQYSLPSSGPLVVSPDYADLSAEVHNLRELLSSLQREDQDSESMVMAVRQVNRLRFEVESIAMATRKESRT